MEYIKNKKAILIILPILLAGLAITVYLVTKPQIFKSRATTNFSDAFEITDTNGNVITCQENICTTKSLFINFKIKDLTPLQKEPI